MQSDDDEPTATDERAAANASGTPIVPVNRNAGNPRLEEHTGLPAGQVGDQSSPLDGPDQATAKT